MRSIFEEYSGLLSTILVTFGIILIMNTMYPIIIENSKPRIVSIHVGDNSELSEKDKPILVAKSAIINQYEPFDFTKYVQAYDKTGRNLISNVSIIGKGVNEGIKGSYTVTFKCLYNRVASYTSATYIVE